MIQKQKKQGTLNTTLWVLQVILALSFMSGAMMKFFMPTEKLATMWGWTADNRLLVKTTAILDMFAGLGLILPALLRIQPKLTIYAAYATIVLMLAAIVFHIARNEASQMGGNIFFTLSALFIAWGRSKKVPLVAKKIKDEDKQNAI